MLGLNPHTCCVQALPPCYTPSPGLSALIYQLGQPWQHEWVSLAATVLSMNGEISGKESLPPSTSAIKPASGLPSIIRFLYMSAFWESMRRACKASDRCSSLVLLLRTPTEAVQGSQGSFRFTVLQYSLSRCSQDSESTELLLTRQLQLEAGRWMLVPSTLCPFLHPRPQPTEWCHPCLLSVFLP